MNQITVTIPASEDSLYECIGSRLSYVQVLYRSSHFSRSIPILGIRSVVSISIFVKMHLSNMYTLPSNQMHLSPAL